MEARVLKLKAPRYEPVYDQRNRLVPYLYLNTKTKTFYVIKRYGKGIPRLHQTTRECLFSRARLKAEALMRAHQNQHLGISDPYYVAKSRGKSVAEVCDFILQTYTPRLRKTTQAKHKIIIGQLKDHFGQLDVNTFTAEVFIEKVQGLQANSKRRTTFTDYSKFMNLIFRKAYGQKWVSHLIKFPNLDEKKENSGRCYTKDEIEALYKVIPSFKMEVLFDLSFKHMMRLREALWLSKDRFDEETGRITLRASDVKTGSRTGKGRKLLVSEETKQKLIKLKKQTRGSEFFFPARQNSSRPMHDIKAVWKTMKKNSKIKGKARWHDLRHTALTFALLEKGLNPMLVSEYAGVSMQTIQRVYLHSDEQKTKSVAASITI